MRIIFKHILRNIYANKWKSILIVFSIMVVSALLLITLSISDVMNGEYEKLLRNENGSSDILIRTETEKRNQYFEYTAMQSMAVVPEIESVGFLEKEQQSVEWFELHAISQADLQKCYTVGITSNLNNFEGGQIVISERAARELSLQTGEVISLVMGGQSHNFRIAAIATDSGLFADEARFKTAIIPLKTAQEVFNCEDKANRLNIFLDDKTEIQAAINTLSGKYPGLAVEETVSQRDIETQTGSFSLIFFLMFFASCAMCVFIVYTGFKAIIAERLTVLGTFRSVGATKRKCNLFLLSEVLIYGIIGGVLALAAGTLGLLLVANLLGAGGTGLTAPAGAMSGAFAFSVALSFLCAIPLVITSAKMPIKEIVLGSHISKMKKSVVPAVTGGAFLAAGLIIPSFQAMAYNMPLIIMAVALVFCGIVLMIPLAASLMARFFEIIAPDRLAPKNLRKNKRFISIISLITIGMSVLLLISNSNWVLNSATDDAYALINYQIEAIGTPTNQELADKLSQIDGVEAAGGVFVKTEAAVSGYGPLMTVFGMDEWKFHEFFNYTTRKNSTDLFNSLTAGKSILISKDYLQRFGLNVGDKIELAGKGNELAQYTITGIVDEMQNSGNVAFISEGNFKSDFGKEFYSFIAVKSGGNADENLKNIRSVLWDTQVNLTTLESLKQAANESSATIFMILNLLMVLSILIGIVGVVNNLVIHFLERKRTLAMLRAIGMSGRSGIKMIAAEALITGIIGAVLGLAGGWCITQMIPALMRLFEFPAKPVPFQWEQAAVCLLSGIVICLAGAAGSIRRANKLNIISAIKYK